MNIETLGIILGSSVIASLVTAIFTKSSKDKTDKLQYITNERKQWRDDIRKATVEIRKINDNEQKEKMFKTIQEAKTYFQVRLNPEDEEDNKLLACFETTNNKVTDNLDEYVARLLKHDWERVKKETDRNFIKIYYVTIIFIVLVFIIYPMSDWLGLKEQQANIDVLILHTLLNEIVHYRTLFLLTFFPVLLSVIKGVWIFSLKIMNISTKHENKKAAFCSWLKIPYRGMILNS
jgi:CRISPR/Cas system CMR-associated protein Cmr5 small subunit